jgi:serine protease AprX
VAAVEGPEAYAYWGSGGVSWAAPYLAGLVALGMQARPDLKPADLYAALAKTATRSSTGLNMANPARFIEQLSR